MINKLQNYIISKQALFLGFVLAAFILLLVYSCSLSKPNETKPIVYQLNDAKFQEGSDRKNASFIVSSAEIYLHEIRLSQLAQARGHRVDVRELGKINESYNTQKLINLMKLAKAKSISIPTTSGDKNDRIFSQLANQSENSFDRNYCDMMVKDHKKSILLFETIVSESTDEDIRNWAEQSLEDMNKQLSYATICRKSCINKNNFLTCPH